MELLIEMACATPGNGDHAFCSLVVDDGNHLKAVLNRYPGKRSQDSRIRYGGKERKAIQPMLMSK